MLIVLFRHNFPSRLTGTPPKEGNKGSLNIGIPDIFQIQTYRHSVCNFEENLRNIGFDKDFRTGNGDKEEETS